MPSYFVFLLIFCFYLHDNLCIQLSVGLFLSTSIYFCQIPETLFESMDLSMRFTSWLHPGCWTWMSILRLDVLYIGNL